MAKDLVARRRPGSVVVIGAGIAGLTAAHRLQAGGVRVTVLEAEDGPGGRMSTLALGGGRMERGAQFLSSGYTIVPELLEATGLARRTSGLSGRSVVVADGRSWRFDTRRPVSLVTGGLLRARDVVAAVGSARSVRRLAHRPTHDLRAWLDLDGIDAQTWGDTRLGRGLTRRLLAPTVLGLYFQDLPTSSAALAGALTAFSARRASAWTIAGGLGELTCALARSLDVAYGTRVEGLERPVGPDDPVVIGTGRGTRHADAVVIAVPGSETIRILGDLEPAETDVLRVPYSPALLVGVALDRPLAREELCGAYGIVFSPEEPSALAAIAVHSRADHTATQEVLTLMLRPASAVALLPADDDQAVAVAVEAAGALLPRLADRVRRTRVVRWRQAMPCVPPGHAAAVRRYRTQLPPDSRVVLAGDYLGFPWSDSAAQNGRWAAERLLTMRTLSTG